MGARLIIKAAVRDPITEYDLNKNKIAQIKPDKRPTNPAKTIDKQLHQTEKKYLY